MLPHKLFPTTRLLLRCGPPRYRPSAVQSTIFCCQANKWLVSEAVSVYWLLILSLSRGWRGALHSPPLCSVNGKVLTLLISFFTALCQNIQLQTLKTSAIARHLQPYTAPLIMVDSVFWRQRKGWWVAWVEDDWRTQSKASAALSVFSLYLTLSLSILTQRKYCTLTDSHWIHVVIHRPISNCQAAKLHQVCQNSSQEHAGDVKN